jgi:flagellar biosynthesis/type III secretory pathway chaperone
MPGPREGGSAALRYAPSPRERAVTMEELLEKLLGVLTGETELYRGLLQLLQEEKKAVVCAELKGLNETGKEKESLILKIRILEEERVKLLKKIAAAVGSPSPSLTLNELARSVKEPFTTRLTECSSTLLALLQSIQELNHTNKALLLHSLELVRGSMTLLNNVMAAHPVYFRTGKMQTGTATGKVLSGKI